MRLSRSHLARSLLLAVVALGAAACGPGAGSAGPVAGSGDPSGGAIKVVTTTTVFADIVQNVGGSRVSATSIVPPGVGPEDYEPKPEDARKLADAQLIVSNGVGLDDFLERGERAGLGNSDRDLHAGTAVASRRATSCA